MKAKLIVFEGPEGSGKSTQAGKVLSYLKKKGVRCALLREPGGSKISEKIRSIILDRANRKMTARAELLLYEASRSQLTAEKILPLLKKGTTVLLDRFYMATVVYQGYGRGLDIKLIKQLNLYAAHGLKPALTFVYDVMPEEAAKRMAGRGGRKDRIELEDRVFHEKVRKGYVKEARADKSCALIDTSGKNEEQVFKETLSVLEDKL